MITVAQIGCGYWGPNLLKNLHRINEFDLHSVVEYSADRRNFVIRNFPGLAVSDDVESVFGDAAVDAVVIATPASTHFRLASEALNRGKHVFVEKPMATSREEVEALKALAESRGLTLMVGHTFLYNTAVRYLKVLIDSGDLGEVRYIYCQRLNLGKARTDVDVWWNLAPHDVSIIQYLLDDPEPLAIRRTGEAYLHEEIDDIAFVNINYPDKVLASVHVSWLDPCKTRKITVVGSKKMVVFDDVSDEKIKIYNKGIEASDYDHSKRMDFDDLNTQFIYRFGDVTIPALTLKEPLNVELTHFAECCMGIEECISGANHALKVVSILERGSRRSAC